MMVTTAAPLPCDEEAPLPALCWGLVALFLLTLREQLGLHRHGTIVYGRGQIRRNDVCERAVR